MREFRIPLNRYDLSRFIGEIFEFMHKNDISPSMVACFSEDGIPAELKAAEISRGSVEELLLQDRILFLPFSDINIGEPIPCADGKSYSLSTSNDLDEEVLISANPVESVGFLVQVEEGEVIICGAVFRGGEYNPIEGVELDEDLKEFSRPMALFVERFKVD